MDRKSADIELHSNRIIYRRIERFLEACCIAESTEETRIQELMYFTYVFIEHNDKIYINTIGDTTSIFLWAI